MFFSSQRCACSTPDVCASSRLANVSLGTGRSIVRVCSGVVSWMAATTAQRPSRSCSVTTEISQPSHAVGNFARSIMGVTSWPVPGCNPAASERTPTRAGFVCQHLEQMYRDVNGTRRRSRPRAGSHPPTRREPMRLTTVIAGMGVAAALLTAPALAQDVRSDDTRQDRKEIRQDRRDIRKDRRDPRRDNPDIRQDRREIRQDTKDIRADRRDLREDRRELATDRKAGDKDAVKNDLKDIREDRKELKSDVKERRADAKDLRQDRRDRRQDRRDLHNDRKDLKADKAAK